MKQSGPVRLVWGVLAGLTALGPSVRASTVAQIEQELIAAVNRVRPGVVAIKCQGSPWAGGPVHERWASGVVIDPKGHIVTAGESQPGPNGKLEVTGHGGQTWSATFVGYDAHENLSLVKIDAGKLPSVPQAGDTLPTEGTLIIAVGNPYGFAGSVAYGNVSGLNRTIGVGGRQRAGLVQFTAPINPGDSGGCLANVRGEMIGVIVSSLLGPPRVWRNDQHRARTEIHYWGTRPQAIGFAVPIARVRRVVSALMKGKTVQRGYLGVYGAPGPEGGGARVVQLIPGSPGAKAGLRPHDVIISVGKRTIRSFEDLRNVIEAITPGSQVDVVVRRDGNTVFINVSIGKKPATKVRPPGDKWRVHPGPYGDWRDFLPKGLPDDIDRWIPPGAKPYAYGHPQQKPLLGVRTQELSAQVRQRLGIPAGKGVLIVEVLAGSPAANVGLQATDVLLKVDDQEANDPHKLADVLHRTGPGKRVRLTLKRDKTDLVVVVRLAEIRVPKGKAWRWGWSVPRGDHKSWSDVQKEQRRRIEELEKKIKDLQERLKRGAHTQPAAPAPTPPAT